MVKKTTYQNVGENYGKKDPVKKLAQQQAALTSKNILPFKDFPDTRGESAYVWKQGNILMASVLEALGTKNLIADDVYSLTGKSYYENISHDTVATIINDLVTVGARPLTLHAYWAVGHVDWVGDSKRVGHLVNGWKKACDTALVSWGGGESPTLRNIVDKKTIILGGSAVGIIGNKKRFITEDKLKVGDSIILIKSSGPNANGISLIRAISKKLKKGYLTKLSDGQTFGEAVLAKSNIYAKLIKDLLDSGVNIHYAANITGHGFRKIMRAKKNFTYVIEKIFEPQELFDVIQKAAGLTNEEMYATFNMGNDYAIFIPKKDVDKALLIVRKNKFKGISAGHVEKGDKKVIIKPKNIIYNSESLDLR
ncbi:MAG TPA: AIR synthase-related protein [Patescibacteria group bacterium]|nr:AIR synthase-related protein [Patescibacteria group bacterium]